MSDSLREDIATLTCHGDKNILLVGSTALAYNHLIYDGSPTTVWTACKPLDGVIGERVVYQHYHFSDMEFTIHVFDNVYMPNAEKAILDSIVWFPENLNEGYLIEALQTYQEHNDKSKLYECADYYKVPHEFVDYWWKEAEEAPDMSMG